jgi:N-methylhydantoinase A/oxoprolinase/acetone carboxylase beta subunit
MVAEGESGEAIRFEREVDLKYSYQVDSLPLQRSRKGPLANGPAARKPAHRKAYFGPTRGIREAAALTRSDVASLKAGPLIIEEPDTTVVGPPGWMVRRAEDGNLVLEKTN